MDCELFWSVFLKTGISSLGCTDLCQFLGQHFIHPSIFWENNKPVSFSKSFQKFDNCVEVSVFMLLFGRDCKCMYNKCGTYVVHIFALEMNLLLKLWWTKYNLASFKHSLPFCFYTKVFPILISNARGCVTNVQWSTKAVHFLLLLLLFIVETCFIKQFLSHYWNNLIWFCTINGFHQHSSVNFFHLRNGVGFFLNGVYARNGNLITKQVHGKF